MEEERAQSSNALLITNKDALVNRKNNADGREIMVLHIWFPTFEKCPEAIRKRKWSAPTHPKQLYNPKRVVLDFLEPMLFLNT